MQSNPKKIAVTGAAGQICYSLLYRLANGDLYGESQPIELRLLDLPQAQDAVRGVVMELEDCAFPLLHNIVMTDDPRRAFVGVDAAFLVGSRPRSKGMERRDLLAANAEIFKVQGRAINEVARRQAKILVVGNPANTNASILIANAPDFNPRQVSSMIRLDHNRALTQLARKAGCGVGDIDKLVVWGNHSPTMFADWTYAMAAGKPLSETIADNDWYKEVLIPDAQGAALRSLRHAAHRLQHPPPMPRSIRCVIGCTARTGAGYRWRLPQKGSMPSLKALSAVCLSFARTVTIRSLKVSISTGFRRLCWRKR